MIYFLIPHFKHFVIKNTKLLKRSFHFFSLEINSKEKVCGGMRAPQGVLVVHERVGNTS